jgi:hypothetical protein
VAINENGRADGKEGQSEDFGDKKAIVITEPNPTISSAKYPSVGSHPSRN